MALLLTLALDPETRKTISSLARGLGRDIIHADAHADIQAVLQGRTCDIAIYALRAENKDDWPLMRGLAHLPGNPEILAAVEKGDTAAAEYAVQSGSWDIIYAPCPEKEALSCIQRCLEHRLHRNTHGLEHIKRAGIIGDSPLLERCLLQMDAVAKSDSSVLILGETGTGKELFARAVHENSRRSNHPLIVVDCTNLPPTLAESILFGHAKGSFTGAVESSDGLFRQADKGSIFLDEIGELDLNIQKSLLRVIQERRFRPLSAKHEIECDFRIIAATNRDLEAMVHEGGFRQDLYHRVNTRIIVLPTLRERKEDIPALAAYYADLACKNLLCPPKEITGETLEAFKLYPWPGNIRELANVVQTTVLNGIAEHNLHPQHLPEELRLFLIRAKINARELTPGATPGRPCAEERAPEREPFFSFDKLDTLPTFKEARDDLVRVLERSYLAALISRAAGNFSLALNISGLSRARLYELLHKHGLSI